MLAEVARLAPTGGNPSSPHAEGRAARAALDAARDEAAAALGVDADEIVFTASGTEAVNLALLGTGRRLLPGGRAASWTGEHAAVLGALRRLQLEGLPLDLLPVDRQGRLGETAPPACRLLSGSLADNEVGTLRRLPRAPAGCVVHLDACQGPRWVAPDLAGVDLAAFSGAKLGAGRGGLLFVRRGVALEPLAYGGPQERGRRAGSEDVDAARAIARALAVTARRREGESERVRPLGARLTEAVVELGGELTGAPMGERLPNLVSAVFPGVRAETLLTGLDLAGLAASAGAACASGSLDPSPALLAMGYPPPLANASLRLSLGYQTSPAEVERAISILRGVVPRLRKVPV